MINTGGPMHNKILRVLVTVLLVFTTSTILNIGVQAATVNDVRELVGRQRITDDMLQKEKDNVVQNYLVTEMNNVAASMSELNDEIINENEKEVDQIQLARSIEKQSDEVYERFASNATADEVLQARTKLDSLMAEVDSFRNDGYSINIEFIPNRWSENYKLVQKKIEDYNEGFNIGDVGQAMKSPVQDKLAVYSPFGKRQDPVDLSKTELHGGLDLEAPLNTNILAQWNGIVSNIYQSDRYGNVLEIQHGPGLLTRYAHLNKILVNIGDEVTQYQVVGLSGNTGETDGPHLHIEIYIDGVVTNPILLYGTKGAEAFKEWLKLHPNSTADMAGIDNIKDSTEASKNGNYSYGFYNELPTNDAKTTQQEVSPGVIIPQLPKGYERPEPGILH